MMRRDADAKKKTGSGKEGTKVRGIKWQICIWMAAALLWKNAAGVCAAEEYGGPPAGNTALLQISVDGGDMVAYVECGDEIASVEAQIAQYPCGDVQMGKAEDISIHTIIMVDNSLSVTEQNRDNIKKILREYVQTMPQQEVVSLAVFGEDIRFLCEKSGDAQEMASLIDGIEFHDQDTYLTDYLYQMLGEIENDTMFTRFILISDGVDNKTIGITKEELNDRLREITRPIYTVGHVYKDNATQLKNMFALSRATGGKELLIEDFENVLDISEEIHDFSTLRSCRIPIPGEVMDGGERHILLNIHTDEGDMEITGNASMPFGLVEREPEAEEPEPEILKESETISEPKPVPAAEPVSVKEPEENANQEKDGGAQGLGNKAATAVLLLIVALAVYMLYRQKRKPGAAKEKIKEKKMEKEKEITPVIAREPEVSESEDATVMLEGRYLLTLQDRIDLEKVFRYPLDDHVIVGRNADMVQIVVDYSLTVSGRHCEFYVQNNRFFIRDMNSANHTYLNGKRVNDVMEMKSGDRVKIGEVEFDVDIMPI